MLARFLARLHAKPGISLSLSFGLLLALVPAIGALGAFLLAGSGEHIGDSQYAAAAGAAIGILVAWFVFGALIALALLRMNLQLGLGFAAPFLVPGVVAGLGTGLVVKLARPCASLRDILFITM